jgi:hypothetical protein
MFFGCLKIIGHCNKLELESTQGRDKKKEEDTTKESTLVMRLYRRRRQQKQAQW